MKSNKAIKIKPTAGRGMLLRYKMASLQAPPGHLISKEVKIRSITSGQYCFVICDRLFNSYLLISCSSVASVEQLSLS